MPTRREIINTFAGAAGLAGFGSARFGSWPALAQGTVDGWPSRSVRVISPTGTGGPGQNFRFYADQLKDKFGQSFVLENMPGGSGAIGCMTVARAAPDGLTLLLASNSHIVLAPLVLTNSPVNVKKDFAPVALMFTFPFLLLVYSGLPVRTLPELVAYAKARPRELNFGSPGVGTGLHIAAEMMLRLAKVQATHVSYKGAAQMLIDLLGNQIDFLFDPGPAIPHVKAGRVRLLAVANATRSAIFPDIPTMAEGGLDVDVGFYHGVYTPAGTPRDIVARLNREINRIMNTPEATAALAVIAAEPVNISAEEFTQHQRRIRERFGVVVREAKIRAE